MHSTSTASQPSQPQPISGMSKVYMLDKYFNELQKFWDTEKRLQDATSSGEAVNLQHRLKTLSTGLVGLRNCLHDQDNPTLPPTNNYHLQGMTPNIDSCQQQQQQHADQSPPKPVSTIQHNYSNIHQPIPRPSASINSSRTQSSNNTSPSLSGGVVAHFGSEGGAFSRMRPRTPPEVRLAKREKMAAEEAKRSKLAEIDDLIHLEPPLSEDAVIRTLQSRFFNQKYFTNVGPVVLSVNSHQNVGNPLTLTSTAEVADKCPELAKVVDEAVRLQNETGYPQTIIVSGSSGSGKTHSSMVLLRQLFAVAGGHESDTFKQLSAAFTVLRSLGSAQTTTNKESSRIGHFIEAQVSDGALYRTKIHCYFLDQGRVVKPPPTEKSYHIFYQMMAGLSLEERVQLGLDNYSIQDLMYLNIGDTRQDEAADCQRFADFKSSLAVLGIPFMDVVRVLSAILLLGNVEFAPRLGMDDSFDIDIIGKDELNTVARLLGISTTLLWQGITTRTHSMRGQPVKSMSDANLCNATRNALAKALYCRTVATIVRRANSLKRPTTGTTMSTESTDSIHHEVASHHASTIGTSSSRKSNRSMALLNHALRHATDGFIGILDMFGFEDSKPSQLEQLCINLCSETMQHFYNTHIFKSSVESCKEEGITYDVTIEYVDNVPCIDLISSLRTGLLSMLDVECSVSGCPETYVQKVKVQHKENKKLFEPKYCDTSRTFGIHHYAGSVVYDASTFLDTNRDVIPDDLVCVFSKENCNFGFASHLFGNEMRSLSNGGNSFEPRGACFRISPTTASHINGHSDTLLNGDEPVSTLTQDFHTRLDNLLRTLVHAKPHFVRCISPNDANSPTTFDRSFVANQIRSLQVLETVNLMASGFPHRMRFKAFNARYMSLAYPMKSLHRSETKSVEDCELILDSYSKLAKYLINRSQFKNNTDWAHGRKHIFLSEGARQQLELLRQIKRHKSASLIQKHWRSYKCRRNDRKSFTNNDNLVLSGSPEYQNNLNVLWMQHQRSERPKPISGTPPPLNREDKCDFQTIQQTCSLFGLDLERPPPVPPSRPYTVAGGKKITFPQTRIMKYNYPDIGQHFEVPLRKGETVIVIGNSQKKGHLVVEKNNHTIHVPFMYLELKQPL